MHPPTNRPLYHYSPSNTPLLVSTADSHRKPVDTPLRGNVPQSALAVGVDHLIRAVFFRHVREAAAALQNVGGRVVKEHYEAGIAVITEAQREHGAITDEKARNVVALYAALIGMSEQAGADAT